MEAIEIYGKDWKKVQKYVGTRTSTQARSHAQKVLRPEYYADLYSPSTNASLSAHNSPKKHSSKIAHLQKISSPKEKPPSPEETQEEGPIFRIQKEMRRNGKRKRAVSENEGLLHKIEGHRPRRAARMKRTS